MPYQKAVPLQNFGSGTAFSFSEKIPQEKKLTRKKSVTSNAMSFAKLRNVWVENRLFIDMDFEYKANVSLQFYRMYLFSQNFVFNRWGLLHGS